MTLPRWTVHPSEYDEVRLSCDGRTRALFWGTYAQVDAERCARLLNATEPEQQPHG